MCTGWQIALCLRYGHPVRVRDDFKGTLSGNHRQMATIPLPKSEEAFDA
jgi:hypothetical protein